MRFRILSVFLAGLAAASCVPDWAKENDADVVLILQEVNGQSGGSEGQGVTQLLSDVRTDGSIFNDNAELVLSAIPKVPTIAGPFVQTGLNDVILRRYTVEYYRGDGRSVQGVDVPHNISGEMNGTVPVNGTLTTSIIVVRHQAKMEPPLRNLAVGGGAQCVTVFAKITVYGSTMAKRDVTATGQLEIVFCDFGDE